MDTNEETINTKAIIELVTLELKRFSPDITLELETFAYRVVTKILDAAYAQKLRVEYPERYEVAEPSTPPPADGLTANCLVCNEPFPTKGLKKVCSKKKCKKEHLRAANLAYYYRKTGRKIPVEKDVRQPSTIACALCGGSMEASVSGEKTCSKAENPSCHSKVRKMKHRIEVAVYRRSKNPAIKLRAASKLESDLSFLRTIGYAKAVNFAV